jgi:hypothetical protein
VPLSRSWEQQSLASPRMAPECSHDSIPRGSLVSQDTVAKQPEVCDETRRLKTPRQLASPRTKEPPTRGFVSNEDNLHSHLVQKSRWRETCSTIHTHTDRCRGEVKNRTRRSCTPRWFVIACLMTSTMSNVMMNTDTLTAIEVD